MINSCTGIIELGMKYSNFTNRIISSRIKHKYQQIFKEEEEEAPKKESNPNDKFNASSSNSGNLAKKNKEGSA